MYKLLRSRFFFSSSNKFHSSQTATLKDKLILVDENDNYISSIQKQKAHRWEYIQTGKPHRAFSVFLFDETGRLLMQQRSKLKILFPEMWTNSCCSHPLIINENPIQIQEQQEAVRTRVPFQLGISIDSQPLTFISKLVYKAQGFDKEWGQYQVDSIFFSRTNSKPTKYNIDEVMDIDWVKLNEIDSFIKAKDGKITPWFQQIYDGNLKQWWKTYIQ